MNAQSGSILVVVGLAAEAGIAGERASVAVGTAALDGAAEGAIGLLSFGLCAALSPALSVGNLIVGDGVAYGGQVYPADRGWTDRLAGVSDKTRRGLVAGNATILQSAEEKARLAAASGAMAADMESHIVALTAKRLGLPFAILRAVSDDARRALPHAAVAGFSSDGRANVSAVLASLLRRPGEVPDLVRTALEAGWALRALRRVAPAVLALRP